MGPQGRDPLEELELTRAGGSEGESEPAAAMIQWSWEEASGKGLPSEPSGSEGGAQPSDSQQVPRELLAFHLHGRRPPDAREATGPAPLPALLHPYRDLTQLRHDYPICLNGAGQETAVRPLTEIVDSLLGEITGPDDAGEQRRRDVYRVESIVRSLARERDGEPLSALWDRASRRLLESSRLADDKRKILDESMVVSRQALGADGEVVWCGPHAPERLLRSSMSVYWRERRAAWRDDLERLIGQLRDILSADFSQSEAANSPEHLRESLGTAADDVDVRAMSSVLASRPRESALPHERRRRVESLLAMLSRMQPLFGDASEEAPAPFPVGAVFESVAAAVAEHESRMGLMTEFFKAVRMARLETQNRYQDGVHDALFALFDRGHLSAEELALCPPVLVRLAGDAASRDEIEPLLSLLSTTRPLKILVVLSSVHRGDGGGNPVAAVAWPARLAAMAATLQHVYVLQAPVSRPSALHAGMLAGLRYAGPALFCVYAPALDDRELPTYLAAAAAAESRVFPILTFDPSKGTTIAERVDLGENPQSGKDWPVERFSYQAADGTEASREIAFTPADFLFCVSRRDGGFWIVPAERWHESMAPLHEYLEMPAAEAADKIPYLSIVDGDGHVGRAVVNRAVIDFSLQCRSFWRGMQDWGGVHNSFAARLLAAEQQRLVADKNREVEAIERNYQAQLDQDVGKLTKEIVQRIAGRLLGMEGGTLASGMAALAAVPGPVATPPAAVAPAPAPQAQLAEPDVEPPASFDDPYIDTPLCTSCNECTRINARLFVYNSNKQAEIGDATAGSFSDLVRAAELCPVHIIHPGKPRNPGEPGLDELVKRAASFN
jgi:hypothetical protein